MPKQLRGYLVHRPHHYLRHYRSKRLHTVS
jgi:hypothetical protein